MMLAVWLLALPFRLAFALGLRRLVIRWGMSSRGALRRLPCLTGEYRTVWSRP